MIVRLSADEIATAHEWAEIKVEQCRRTRNPNTIAPERLPDSWLVGMLAEIAFERVSGLIGTTRQTIYRAWDFVARPDFVCNTTIDVKGNRGGSLLRVPPSVKAQHDTARYFVFANAPENSTVIFLGYCSAERLFRSENYKQQPRNWAYQMPIDALADVKHLLPTLHA